MPSTTRPPLRDMRREAGYSTGSAFAEALHIPVSTYCRYERAPRSIPLGSAWAIADALGVTIDAVVGRESSVVMGDDPTLASRLGALDLPSRQLIGEWLELLEGMGRSRLFPEGR